MTETQIQQTIMDYLRYKGWTVYAPKQPGIRGKYTYPGIPDLICHRNMETVYVEVKNNRGKIDPDQIKFKEMVEDAGIMCVIARDMRDVQDLDKDLKAFKRRMGELL